MIVWFVNCNFFAGCIEKPHGGKPSYSYIDLAMFFLLGWLAGRRLNYNWRPDNLYLKFVDSDSLKFKFISQFEKCRKSNTMKQKADFFVLSVNFYKLNYELCYLVM
jgi:hypothetical protein